VRHLAGLGIPQDDIARIVGCATKTLRNRLREELDRGVAEANAMISGSLLPREGGQYHGDHLQAEDQSALARADSGGRHCQPGWRIEFGGRPGPARQQPRSRLTRVLRHTHNRNTSPGDPTGSSCTNPLAADAVEL
jgi:hypothetical protein